MSAMRVGRAHIVWAALVVWTCGCGHASIREPPAATPESPAAARVQLAQECQRLTASHAANERAYSRVFVEIADVTTAEPPHPTAEFLRQNPVELAAVRVAGVLADEGRPTVVPWSACHQPNTPGCGQAGEKAPSTLQFTAELPESAAGLIKLTGLRLLAGEASEGAGGGMQLETYDQRPVIAELAATQTTPPSRLAITPYLIGEDADLRLLLDCRRTAADAAVSSRNP